MHLLVLDYEADTRIRILYWISGSEDILSGWSENAQRKLIVLRLHCGKERAGGFIRRRKSPLSRLLGERWRKPGAQKKRGYQGCKSNNTFFFRVNGNRISLQHGVPLIPWNNPVHFETTTQKTS
jgi:hypothetical protein